MAEKKKVVRVEAAKTAKGEVAEEESTWKPTPEAKKKALTLRLIAGLLWLVAIGVEAFAIFWVLRQEPVNMWLLIGAIVVTGILAVVGSLLWKKANRADPASKKDPVRFFIQNQLGVIIAIIAFLPLIILIFTNKNMDGKQKAIAGGIGIVVLLIAGVVGADFRPPSVEDYATDTAIVKQLTGSDVVYWTKSGSVYHLCEDASAVNQESKDGQIYSGTVGTAKAEGKSRLTKQVEQELKQCGLEVPENLDEILAGTAVAPVDGTTEDEEPAEDEAEETTEG